MRRLVAAILTVVLLGINPLVGNSSAKSKTTTPLMKKSSTKPILGKNRLIVKYRKDPSLTSIDGLYKSKTAIKGGALSLKAKSEEAAKEAGALLENDPNVEYVEPDYVRKLSVSPNDTYYSLQYGLSKMSAPKGWDIERGFSHTVTVAVIDTGVDLDHPDLKNKIVAGWDFVHNDDTAQDDHGHGTHVAGIAAASANNGAGVAGVSWGAKIMPIKVLDSAGSGYDSWVASGIRYAADHGANVINMSLGGAGYSSTLKSATDYAYSKNVLVVAAAGNSGDKTINYPAGNPNVVGVGATGEDDKIASFSTHNSSVDVSAPGVNIASTYWYYGSPAYAYMSGTSMATPNVAGLAALVKSKWPSYSAPRVAERLMYYSDDRGAAGKDTYYGHGRINIYRALNPKALKNIVISIRATKRKVRAGKTVVIRGKIKPSKKGKVVLKYRKGRSKWRVLKRVKLKKSFFKTRVRLNSRAKYTFAVRYHGRNSKKVVVYGIKKRARRARR